LVEHLEKQQIQFVQFAFRWFNCLLMREFPLPLIIRMWDTYLAEVRNNWSLLLFWLSQGDAFPVFHLYVCASYLVTFSKRLMSMDFQELMIFLQNPPTSTWAEADIETMLSRAYMWKTLFDDSPSHLRTWLTVSLPTTDKSCSWMTNLWSHGIIKHTLCYHILRYWNLCTCSNWVGIHCDAFSLLSIIAQLAQNICVYTLLNNIVCNSNNGVWLVICGQCLEM